MEGIKCHLIIIESVSTVSGVACIWVYIAKPGSRPFAAARWREDVPSASSSSLGALCLVLDALDQLQDDTQCGQIMPYSVMAENAERDHRCNAPSSRLVMRAARPLAHALTAAH